MWSPHGEEGTSRRQSGCREEGTTLAVPRLRALSEPSAGPHPLSEPQPFSAPPASRSDSTVGLVSLPFRKSETQARRPSGQARSLPRSTVSASRSQTLRGCCLPQAPSAACPSSGERRFLPASHASLTPSPPLSCSSGHLGPSLQGLALRARRTETVEKSPPCPPSYWSRIDEVPHPTC